MVFFVNITFLDFQEVLTFLTENQKMSNLSLKKTHEILGHADKKKITSPENHKTVFCWWYDLKIKAFKICK